MLPVPLYTVLDGPYLGGNHAAETVQNWECRAVAYKKGAGAYQEDDGLDDDLVDSAVPFSLPEPHLDAITPALSLLDLSKRDLKTLRSRFLLDQSIKDIMVLVGTRYTLNEK
jgi:hypothetical protein